MSEQKMICIIYSNCQGRGVRRFLEKQDNFRADYSIHVINNYTAIAENKELPTELLKKADLFIYQPIHAKHGIYSSDKVLSLLSEKCKCISFPYIYNDALWPIFEKKGRYVGGNSVICLMKENKSLKYIIDTFMKLEIDFDFTGRFSYSNSILKKKEQVTTVKVADFIKQNFRSRRLFLTCNHPTSYVFAYCVNQILARLGYDLLENAENLPENIANLPGFWPVSPYDRMFYKFHFKEDKKWKKHYVDCIGEIYLKHMNNKTKWNLFYYKIYIEYKKLIYSLLRV